MNFNEYSIPDLEEKLNELKDSKNKEDKLSLIHI